MSEPIQTPEQGTELQEQAIPQASPEMETPQIPDEAAAQTPQVDAQPEDAPQQPAPAPQSPDYKQKFVESQREAILLNERLKNEKTRIESLTKQDTPTDEAMRKVYPEWDTFNDVTKQAYIKLEAQNMRQARIEAQQQDILDRQRLEDQLDEVIENPKFAKLRGKESDFKRFARSPKNRGISAEVLAQAFLFDVEETPTNPTPMREALPTGSGGPRGSLKPKKISIEEAAEIRKTDYKRYKELLDSNQIEELE
jgi:hypothetical protein